MGYTKGHYMTPMGYTKGASWGLHGPLHCLQLEAYFAKPSGENSLWGEQPPLANSSTTTALEREGRADRPIPPSQESTLGLSACEVKESSL